MADRDGIVVVFIRTTTVATRCRHCMRRPPAGVPIIRIESLSSLVARRYYCMPCWDVIVQRAIADVPGLSMANLTGSQAEDLVGVLLGKKPARREDEAGQARPASKRLDLDQRVEVPIGLLQDRGPFDRYHLTGEELAAHVARLVEQGYL